MSIEPTTPRSITGISSMATRGLLADLAGEYRSRSGVSVGFESVGGVDAARRLRAGERVDMAVLAANVIADLEAEGHILAGSRVAVALSPMAMAVPAGHPHPGLASAEDVRLAMIQAGRIGYSTGPSGDHLQRLWEEWGIADRLGARLVRAPPGVPVGTLLARGEADIGFQQWSEFTGVGGIEVVGRLPPEVRTDTIFAGGVTTGCSQVEVARAFLSFAISAEAGAAKSRRGMEPVVPPRPEPH